MKKISLSILFAIMMLGMFAAAASANVPDPGAPDASANGVIPVGTVETDAVGNKTLNNNANDTGVGADAVAPSPGTMADVVNNVKGHKTHGDYQSNTNSCASCHQTHTAKTGSRLLFADNNFKTCVACHDGTLGFYNVFETGENASLEGAGTFAGSHGASMHMANGSVKINAAPGGSRSTSGVWNADFSCSSCHTPHGSYSDRLLHYNPNGFATSPKVTTTYKATVQGVPNTDVTKSFGNYEQGIRIVDTIDNTIEGAFLYRTTTEGVVKVELYNGTKNLSTGVITSAKVVSPWLYGYASHTSPHYTRLYTATTGNTEPATGANGTTRVWYGNTAGVKFNLEGGYVYSTSAAGATKLNEMTHGHIARPYIVKMDLVETANYDGLKIYKTNQAAYWNGFAVPTARVDEFKNAGYTVNASNATSNLGVKMNEYCATCHTDYYTGRTASGNTYFGTDGTAAQRHSTTSDRFSCVRCHYAHGTDTNIMIDANGNTVDSITAAKTLELGPEAAKTHALDVMKDQNPSSALKKYTNMSVCWACHGSSSRATSFKNGGARNADAMDSMPTVDGVAR